MTSEAIEETFEKRDFTGQDFGGKRFVDCVFKTCNLSLTTLTNSRWQQVRFIECKLVGVDWTKCDPAFLHLDFEGCLLRSCNFSHLKLKKATFKKCRIIECHFVECDLSEADFSDVEFQETLIHHSDLRKADFRRSQGFSIDPLTNKVQGARFSRSSALSLLDPLGVKLDD
ncbi:MAG: hypothetical protein K940chlam2_00648 [Chlamydiae bacterium]|nr:hypothetical protein [Chlamydiota bacterium]